MIQLHRLRGQSFYLNESLIETMEATPDTVLSLTNGKKMICQESIEQVCEKILEQRKLAVSSLPQ